MAEYINTSDQIIPPGESVVFSTAVVPCSSGNVRWRPGSSQFSLKGNGCGCTPRFPYGCCQQNDSTNYYVTFGANIAVPTGETVGAISVAFAIDGVTLPETTMEETPAAVEEFSNVSRSSTVQVWNGCCSTFSIRNTSDIPIHMTNPNVVFNKPRQNR